MEEGFVCQTCGDEGFTNAFVYCVKCLDAAIHRYCLNVMPKAFNELVIWYCDHCKVKSSRFKVADCGYVKTKKKQKKERDLASVIKGNKDVNDQENITEHVQCNPNNNRTNEKTIAARLAAKEKENKIRERKLRFEKERNLLAFLLEEHKLLDESQPSVDLDLVQDNYYRQAQPLIHPIWRGSFSILHSNYDQFEGFVAHLSNKACDKVFQEANTLPSLIQLQMHRKSDLWPKSFQECEPSDDKIALYFFPGDPINEKAYDCLVLDMMDKEFAMRAVTTNAELLIFTSILLPPLFCRFQGKYYLWGVFRGKRNDPSSVSKSSSNEDTGMKILDCHSPTSPLVQRKLYMQKRSPLIFEKAIKRDVSLGHDIINCFTRIGWGGVLDFEADEVYPEAVIEWMSSLERTGTSVESVKLTGQVDGKKATLDLKFIQETFNVDTGIPGHPEARYGCPSEDTLAGKRETDIKLWEQMADAIFTPVEEGSLKRKLTPLAKLIWLIGMRNIQPRIEDENVVKRHEVPIIYGLATGKLVISYAHLVMMNIWRAYVNEERTLIPHAYLISRFLKLKNVVPINMSPVMIQEDSCFTARLNFANLACNRKREGCT